MIRALANLWTAIFPPLPPEQATAARLGMGQGEVAPDDEPITWPEFRAHVGVDEAGNLLAGINNLRAARDAAAVIALVQKARREDA